MLEGGTFLSRSSMVTGMEQKTLIGMRGVLCCRSPAPLSDRAYGACKGDPGQPSAGSPRPPFSDRASPLAAGPVTTE